MTTTRIGGAFAAALITAALLVGCGSSAEMSSSAAAQDTGSTPTTVDGMVACDSAAITKAAQGADDAPVALAEPDSFKCADGWAYAYVNVGTGEEQYTSTMVFEAEGQFWIPKDRSKVCTAPGDEVPASIYKDACESN